MHGEEWEKMVLLTALSIIERVRRRRRARRYGYHETGGTSLFEMIFALAYWTFYHGRGSKFKYKQM